MADHAPPGVQRERTALAWERTGIAFVIVGLLFVRAAGRPHWQLPGVASVLLGVGLVVFGARGYARPRSPNRLLASGTVRLAGWGAAAVALSAAGMMLVHGPA